jgi:hypothetical protein
MKIIYHCEGDNNSAVLMAAIHLEKLLKEKKPTKKDLTEIAYFDKNFFPEPGKILFMGKDLNGNEVFVFSRKKIGLVVERALLGIAKIYGLEKELILINTDTNIPWVVNFGWFILRKLQQKKIGEQIITKGVGRCYKRNVQLVEKIKKFAAAGGRKQL